MTVEARVPGTPSNPGNITRRTFLERMIALGMSSSAVPSLLAACGGSEQQKPPTIKPLSPTAAEPATQTGEIGGRQPDTVTPLENVEGTTKQYLSIEAPVPKGNSLLLALQAGTQQDVGCFDVQADEQAYKTNHQKTKTPLYKQPNFYPSDTTQAYILVLEQVSKDAYDLIILQKDGAKPSYEARIAPKDQVDTIIHQMQTVHPELQGVQPFKVTDYQYTLPTDASFA